MIANWVGFAWMMEKPERGKRNTLKLISNKEVFFSLLTHSHRYIAFSNEILGITNPSSHL